MIAASSGAGALQVAPHVWFVLLGATALASAAGVVGVRRGLTAGAALLAASIALAGLAVLVGAELVAMGLVILGGLGGLGLVMGPHHALGSGVPSDTPQQRDGRRRRAGLAVLVGTMLSAITAVASIAAVGAGRLASSVPTTAAILARPLYTGGALLVDGVGLVVLVTLVSSREPADGETGGSPPC